MEHLGRFVPFWILSFYCPFLACLRPAGGLMPRLARSLSGVCTGARTTAHRTVMSTVIEKSFTPEILSEFRPHPRRLARS